MVWDESSGLRSGEDENYWKALLSDESLGASSESPGEEEDIQSSWGVLSQGLGQITGEDSSHDELAQERLEEHWRVARETMDAGGDLELVVTECNRGGLLVELGALCGFVPCSQLAGLPRSASSELRHRLLQEQVGKTLTLRVIEIDRERGRLILSEKAARDHADASQLLDQLQPGDVRHGRVIQVRPFGAFVDLGGLEGLVHISELSWGWVSHPADRVRPGDELEVFVIGVNRAERKVALSVKRLTPDPWSLVDTRYRVGGLVEGVITNVVSFGAFMQLEEGLEGLIHISELANGNFTHPRMVVKEGSRVTALVLGIDSARRRLALSLRQVLAADRLETASGPRLGSGLDMSGHGRRPLGSGSEQ
jgi:small subunit ribosomal protein S1